MQSLSATWSSDSRLRKKDWATTRLDEPGCPTKGIHLPQKCGGGLGHDSASVKAARQSAAGQLCGYSSLEEEGWVETVTTQNAQSRQPHVLSQ